MSNHPARAALPMAAVVRPSSLDDAVTYVLDEKLPSGAARGATMAQALVQAGAMQLVGMESERKAQLADFDNTVVPKASVTQKNGSREAFVIRSDKHACMGCGKVQTQMTQCQGCKNARYCSTACQKHDWNHGHKWACDEMRAAEKDMDLRGFIVAPLTFLQDVLRPDCGKMCGFWVAALAAALEPQSGSDMYGREAAATWLSCYIYLYTGHAVPQMVRNKLALACLWWVNEAAKGKCHKKMLPEAATMLLNVMHSDEVMHEEIMKVHPHTPDWEALTHEAVSASAEDLIYWMQHLLRHNYWPCMPRLAASHGPELSFANPYVAMVHACYALQGSGLAASAFGLLHHRDAVRRLVERWRGAPQSQLRRPRHLCLQLKLGFCFPAGIFGSPDRKVARHFAHAPDDEDEVATLGTADGIRMIEQEAELLDPLEPGGGKAVQIIPQPILCYEYWSLFWRAACTELPLHEENKNYFKHVGQGGELWRSAEQRQAELAQIAEEGKNLCEGFGEEWLQELMAPLHPGDVQALQQGLHHVRWTPE